MNSQIFIFDLIFSPLLTPLVPGSSNSQVYSGTILENHLHVDKCFTSEGYSWGMWDRLGPGTLCCNACSWAHPSSSNNTQRNSVQFSSVQSLSQVWLFTAPWTVAYQASLSITNSRSLPKLMSIESVMPSNHLMVVYIENPKDTIRKILRANQWIQQSHRI